MRTYEIETILAPFNVGPWDCYMWPSKNMQLLLKAFMHIVK